MRPEAQYRLRCTFAGVQEPQKGPNAVGGPTTNDAKFQKQIESLTRKVRLVLIIRLEFEISLNNYLNLTVSFSMTVPNVITG
jgi:hypothetical protein